MGERHTESRVGGIAKEGEVFAEMVSDKLIGVFVIIGMPVLTSFGTVLVWQLRFDV
jgi:hypothetical protein